MEIHIRKDAGALALCSNTSFRYAMALLENEWLEVETDYLFCNQYNTAPITNPTILERLQSQFWAKVDGWPQRKRTEYSEKCVQEALKSITGIGLRVMDHMVDFIVGDIRYGAGKCHWCGNWWYPKSKDEPCPKCGHTGYEKLDRVAIAMQKYR